MMPGVAGDTDERLLNIRQAAGLLNVSVVSIRRWTNSGRLGCVRVGVKRERRFRRADLEVFIESQSAGAAGPAAGARINVEGFAIDHGSHLCVLYGNDLGRVKMAVPFLAGGLEGGETCFLAAGPDAERDILGHLGAVCGGLADHVAGGRLLVCPGMPSAALMYAHLEGILIEATRAGQRSIRVLGDMAWAFHQGLGLDELMAFEMRFNHSLARRFPVVSVCQYDARRFSGGGVLDALKCHPDTFRYPLERFLN